MKPTHNSISVNQYTLNGEFVARHESASRAAQKVGLKKNLTIIMCCRRERNVAAGFLWRFDGDTDLTFERQMRPRSVVQLDLDGNFVSLFKTIKEASELTNSNAGHISSCCSGKLEKTKGFKWMYEEDYNKLKQPQL